MDEGSESGSKSSEEAYGKDSSTEIILITKGKIFSLDRELAIRYSPVLQKHVDNEVTTVHLDRNTDRAVEATVLLCRWLRTGQFLNLGPGALPPSIGVLEELWHVARELDMEELKIAASEAYKIARKESKLEPLCEAFTSSTPSPGTNNRATGSVGARKRIRIADIIE